VSPDTVAVPTGRRAVTIRHELHATLEAVTALRAGGWGTSADADLVVARDGLGRVVIPGTSLAGALRAWLGSLRTVDDGDPLFDRNALGKVFGDLEHRGQGGELCRIRVDDAVADGEIPIAVRDGVGIDRAAGTAAAGVLYQHEVVPPGTRFAVRITAAQAGRDAERVAEALDLLVAALAEGRVEIGAARTRGLGRVRMTGIRRTRVDLTDRGQVLAWLCGQPAPAPEPAAARELPADGRLGIEITWSALTPVMVKASTVNEPEPGRDRAVDTVPLRIISLGHNGGARLLLPGSSIKGVVRSHAERVVRTLWNIHDLPAEWLDQLNDPRLSLVGALFGTAGDHSGRRRAPAAPERAPLEQAAPAVHEPAATEPAAASSRADRATAAGRERAGRRGALAVRDCLGTAVTERVVTHVAVDRWTGGAAENLLFSVLEPASAEWAPIRMSVDARRARAPGDPDGEKALALLLLVLRDLADGWLALGFGGTRGRGSIAVSQVAFSGSGLPGAWAALAGRTLAEMIADPPAEIRAAFATWQEAVPS
jgi:CRISPR/Cas system CSM-associated protein Csm3 (group 7 of RAMP superfamily)